MTAKRMNGLLTRLGVALVDLSEKWFPDALVFAFIAILVVFGAGLILGNPVSQLTKAFGEGFWQLIPFTLQMVMVIIGGYVVAVSPPILAAIRRLAALPRTPRAAVALVAFFSSISSLLSWGFSLVFSGLLVREIVQQVRGTDYRAAGAAAYLGAGSVWALGLSSSAALLMATRESIPVALLKTSGVIPLANTILTWQSALTAVIVTGASVWIAYASTPPAERAAVARVALSPHEDSSAEQTAKTPGEWLERSGLLTVLICLVGAGYVIQVFREKGPLAALDLNTYNFFILMLGMLLHWSPRAFITAVMAAVPATAGVIIQFPFYGGIFGLMTRSSISGTLAQVLVRVSTRGAFPLVVSIYSAVLGLFVPSGGGKWLIEAPYLLEAANQLHVNLGWVVQTYNTAEALPNLVNPFWMLPVLGLLNVRARELVGYSLLQLIVHIPLVLFLMWLLAKTLPYVPPSVT